MIGRLHHVILDCQDPAALGAFYSALLGLPVTYSSDDFVVVAASDRASGLAFQRVPGHRAPTWPQEAVPQQVHVDVMVDDVTEASKRVQAIGARPLPSPDAGGHVFADPAGHPFCLIPRPAWAPPVGGLLADQDSVGQQRRSGQRRLGQRGVGGRLDVLVHRRRF